MPGKGEGNGKKKEDEKFDLSKDKSFIDLQNTMKGLGAIVKQGQTQSSGLEAKFDAIAAKIDALGTPKKKETGPDDEHINEMDQATFSKYIVGQVSDLVTAKGTEIQTGVNKDIKTLSDSQIAAEIAAFAGKHKDFWEFKDEIGTIAKAHGSLSIQEMYDKARYDSPDKAKEMDNKYKAKDGEGDETKDKTPKFGGLTPTSGVMVTGDDGKKLDKEKAADKAWNDLLADAPEAATFLKGEE